MKSCHGERDPSIGVWRKKVLVIESEICPYELFLSSFFPEFLSFLKNKDWWNTLTAFISAGACTGCCWRCCFNCCESGTKEETSPELHGLDFFKQLEKMKCLRKRKLKDLPQLHSCAVFSRAVTQKWCVTFWRLKCFLQRSDPTSPSWLPFKRWNYFTPLQSVILFIRLNICLSVMNSAQELHTPPIRLRSGCTEILRR